jgi:splicing factor 3B subunit 2
MHPCLVLGVFALLSGRSLSWWQLSQQLIVLVSSLGRAAQTHIKMAQDQRKLTKNEKRRLREKDLKANAAGQSAANGKENVVNSSSSGSSSSGSSSSGSYSSSSSSGRGKEEQGLDIEIEYVSAELEYSEEELAAFGEVFNKITKPEQLLNPEVPEEEVEENLSKLVPKDEEDEEQKTTTLSRKKKKILCRMSMAELKQQARNPELVEAHDVTSADPLTLVYLKSTRNTVPVPRHWCQVRKYLQGKRGVEKIPFQLPEFIADTGIAKIRESVLEQEAAKRGKQKARDRMKPKMGKIDIDYQVLHDAFFKYQTKPKLSKHGDLYYEGKEFEINMTSKKPGILSPSLREALSMPEGADTCPPPWLINMQRYGMPPSYPNLRIPGLNAPLPPKAAYGYQPGGWGKPPVDEYGRPLYGDVFGTSEAESEQLMESIDQTFRWGQVDPEEEVRPGFIGFAYATFTLVLWFVFRLYHRFFFRTFVAHIKCFE